MSTITDWTGKTTRLAYDGANRLLSMARPNGTMRINNWDAAGQLTSVNDRASGAGGLPVVAMKIGYDAAGRLTSKLELPPWPAATALPARAATYNPDNQLTALNSQSIASDSDGNLTSAPPPTSAGTPVSYTWNTRNQLTAAPGGLTQSYDAEGMRTATIIGGQTTTYVNDPQGSLSRMLWRIRPDGTRTFYIHGPGLLYEIEETGSVARYYHYDHLGSTLALTDQTGAVTGRANYSAYGVLLQTSGTLNTPFLWQGMFGVVTDANGLLYMRARYYHAYLGRFMCEDPLGLSAGPNVYAYCDGDPVSYNDPLGLKEKQPSNFYKGQINANTNVINLLNNRADLINSVSAQTGVDPNLVRATIVHESRGFGTSFEGLEAAVSNLRRGESGSYGFAQLGPDARKAANLTIPQARTMEGSIKGASIWLGKSTADLRNAGIASPSVAQVASQYNSSRQLGLVSNYGREVDWTYNAISNNSIKGFTSSAFSPLK